MKIELEKFAACVDLVMQVPQQAEMECSRYVRLHLGEGVLTMRLTGLAMAMAGTKIPTGAKHQTFYADRRALQAFCSVAGKEIDCTFAEGVLKLKSGRHRVELTQPAEISGYGVWTPAAKATSLKPAQYAQAVQLLANYVPKGTIELRLQAVQAVRGWGWLAGDGFALVACVDSSVPVSLAVPPLLAHLLGAEDREKLRVEPAGVSIHRSYGYVFQTLNAEVAKYPVRHVRNLVEQRIKQRPVLAVKAGPLAESLKHLSRFNYGDEPSTLLCVAEGKKICLRFSATGVQAECGLSLAPQGRLPAQWSWELGRLLPFIQHADVDTEVRIATADRSTSFVYKQGACTYVLILVEAV